MKTANVLIIAEHDHQNISLATRKVVTAAASLRRFSSDLSIHILVVGFQCGCVAQQAAELTDIDKVLLVDDVCYQHGLAENVSKVIKDLASNYSHIFMSSSTSGKDLLPRVSAMLCIEQLSDVMEFTGLDSVVRPIYAGNATVEVKSCEALMVATIRAASFEPCGLSEQTAKQEILKISHPLTHTRFVSMQTSNHERPDLTTARVVVAGGRGVASKDGFLLIEQLADTLHGAVGASRAAVDAGFVPNDYQVGQTGKIIAPDLYIAIGISGAIQHIAGIKDAKVIVAINSDPDASIFSYADYGLVGDLFELIPHFIQQCE
ncbi:electron transfer flavoprotein subunit alpha [Photobacterium angustum]|uniref:electron transfer flavoprotein subunit alpha/FixB family protein n=1 Tax=Photobacterium angustum TaxID=661 RepID=UPI0005E6D26A|nr:FAD-binding protein [Photobacterium angustum]KJG29085.1 electron transfer flavoprotein subunit beta [Photobacterium angustum]PSW91529.1 electron transfer flavoprotein subunit alpha [Photobacterium angustum]